MKRKKRTANERRGCSRIRRKKEKRKKKETYIKGRKKKREGGREGGGGGKKLFTILRNVRSRDRVTFFLGRPFSSSATSADVT
jgi:hypothetical protein